MNRGYPRAGGGTDSAAVEGIPDMGLSPRGRGNLGSHQAGRR